MKTFISLLLLACVVTSFAQYEPKVKEKTFSISVEEGVCSFNGIRIGDTSDEVVKTFGETALVSKVDDKRGSFVTLFYPDYGLEFTLEGEYVRVILLYPREGSVMGDIQKFKVFSRNTNTWVFKDLPLNQALPQDVMMSMGTESINTKLGSGFTSAISNNVMGYKLINSGGSQDIIFYFDNSKATIEHVANRLSQ